MNEGTLAGLRPDNRAWAERRLAQRCGRPEEWTFSPSGTAAFALSAWPAKLREEVERGWPGCRVAVVLLDERDRERIGAGYAVVAEAADVGPGPDAVTGPRAVARAPA